LMRTQLWNCAYNNWECAYNNYEFHLCGFDHYMFATASQNACENQQ
jgi:hypothetical protein